MAEALRRPRPIELPRIDPPAHPVQGGALPARRGAEARRPLHLAVVVGLSAGAYAAALAGVATFQAVSDRELAAANAPAADPLALLIVEHDRLESRLARTGSRYGLTAGAYSDITDQLKRLEDRLGELAAVVKTVEGSAAWVPPTLRLPSVSRSAPQVSRPASNGSTGASGH